MKRSHVILLVCVLIGVPVLGGIVAGVAGVIWYFSSEESSSSGKVSTSKPRDAVIVNGKILSDSDLEEMNKRYGGYPKAGKFWYDPRSGLYGNVGGSAQGFMYPDHNYGSVDPKCSSGDTGVYINGRELAQEEYLFFSAIAGAWIAQGRYWLDGSGDCGYEGIDIPTGNLYAAVQQRMSGGGGAPNGKKDNFWWSRFSAGNSNEDNSAGYVSLPGGGFASYGM